MDNHLYTLDKVAIRMVKEPPLYSTEPIDSPGAAARLLSDFLKGFDRELFCVVTLDTGLRPINISIVSMGTLEMSLVHPREVFKTAILSNAHSILLAHNHPTGNLAPSGADEIVTEQFTRLGELLEIPLQDHIIVGSRESYYSIMLKTEIRIDRHPYEESSDEPSYSESMVKEPPASFASGTVSDYHSNAARKRESMAQIAEKLESGVKALFETDAYKAYLKTMSKFHRYSLNNTILIAMQKPDATLVAGYQTWQKDHGRYVKKGEKGIQILAPAPYRTKIEQDKIDSRTHCTVLDEYGNPVKETIEVERAAFRVATVFDISQTEGKELPTIGVDELTGAVDRFDDMKTALISASPVPVIFEDIEGGAKGFYSAVTNDIHIKQDMSELQILKTLIHEIAHVALHSPAFSHAHPDAEKKDRHTREVEAESIAYCVLQHYNGLIDDNSLDTAEYSFAYIAGWSSGKEVPELRSSLQTIRDTSDTLITEIDGRLSEIAHNRTEKEKAPESIPCLMTLSRLKEQKHEEVPRERVMKSSELVR